MATGIDDLLALAAGAVDDGDGLAAGRDGGVARRRRSVIAAGRVVGGLPGWPGFVRLWPGLAAVSRPAATAIGSPPSGSSAIIAQPAKHDDEQAQQPGDRLRDDDRELNRRFGVLPWPSGALRSSATARTLANHAVS